MWIIGGKVDIEPVLLKQSWLRLKQWLLTVVSLPIVE